MDKKGKRGFFFAITVLVIFPLLFFVIFYYKDKNRPTLETDKCLPIYGPKEAFPAKGRRGKELMDTLYFKVPSFSFTDQNGKTITDSIMHNNVTIVDFFFTTCPSICIDMAKNMRKVQQHFINDSNIVILSHTVDPERDSVQQLFKYAVENDVNSKIWHLLTGDKKDIYRQARNGYFIAAEQQGDGGSNDFIHDQKFIIIDKERRIRGYYDGTDDTQVEQMIKDVEKLLVSYIVPMKKDKLSHSKK